MFDAIVIGGSFAGLSAAMQLARARRRVLVVDSGKPRNRFSRHSHGFFAQDGVPPLELMAKGREKLLAYPNVRFVHDEVTRVAGALDAFSVELASGERAQGRRLVLAFGQIDRLPELPGLAERWGDSVHLCPYCHGYESNEQPLGVLWVSPLSAHQGALLPDWGPVTFFTQGNELEAEARALLDRRGVTIEPTAIVALLGDAPSLSGVRLADGRVISLVGLFIGTCTQLASSIATQLGCALDEAPTGLSIRTDEMKQSSVPGVFAAGDIARIAPNATWASSDGVMAGVACHRSLIFG